MLSPKLQSAGSLKSCEQPLLHVSRETLCTWKIPNSLMLKRPAELRTQKPHEDLIRLGTALQAPGMLIFSEESPLAVRSYGYAGKAWSLVKAHQNTE